MESDESEWFTNYGTPVPGEDDMLNIKQTVKGNILHLEIDLTQRHGLSTSGKTVIVASTQGNVKVADAKHADISVGVNVYTKASAEKPKLEAVG